MPSQQPNFVDYTNNLSLFMEFFEFLETKSELPNEELKSNLHMLSKFFQHVIEEGLVSPIDEYIEEEWEEQPTSNGAEPVFVHNRALNVFRIKDEYFCNQFAFTNENSRYEGYAFTDETYTTKVSCHVKCKSFPIDPTNFEFKVKVIKKDDVEQLLLLSGEYDKLKQLTEVLDIELVTQNL